MTIKIFNDEPPGGSYIFPVFSTGGPAFRERLQAWFCNNGPGPYTATKLSRIYINPTSGIAPSQSVTLQIPLYTQNNRNNLPDPFIDWWTGDTIELFFSSSATPPRALTELINGLSPENPNQAQLTPLPPGLPTCNGCAEMRFFVDTASITKNNPSQLIEFNLGALQACNNAVSSICIRRPQNNQTTLDIRNVDIDVSYVNVAFAPAALAPVNNDQTGFVGTEQTAESFAIALNKFLAGPGKPWPQFVHTYSDKTKESLLKLASPLEVFARFSPPSSCTETGRGSGKFINPCTWDPPTDLCGFTTSWPCSQPTGALLWPTQLWQPLQDLVSNWTSHAGDSSNPNSVGTCGTNPPAGTFCAAIMDVKKLLITNYNKYVQLANAKGCPTVPLNDFVLLAHVYPWTPFVERQGPGGACLGAGDNLLQNSSSDYSSNNFALYQQVKTEFDRLNYNLLPPDPTKPYIFNPWVGCSATSVPNCTDPNGLIHGANFVNAANVYAYSVDDAVGNLQSEGTGFIIDVGSSKNLCSGTTPCPNQNPAGVPVNINFALNPNPSGDPSIINFTNYGLCKFDPNDPVSYKPVNTLSSAFIINSSNPNQCPIFFVDSKSPPQLYTFTVTQPPPYTFFQNPADANPNAETAKVIDCSGNSGPNPPNPINAQFGISSAPWCCQKLAPTRNPPPIEGVWAHSQPTIPPTPHATVGHFVITIPAKKDRNQQPLPPGSCNMGQ
jgi:hypothetical protein